MAHISLDDSLLTINFSLSMGQYDTLVETSAKANALTQVILAHTDDTLENIPTQALYYFLWTLDDLLYQLNELCHSLKPQPPTIGQAPINPPATQTAGGNHD